MLDVAGVDEGLRVTSELLWRSAGVALLVDIPLVVLVARSVRAESFRRLKWHLASAAFLVYAALWAVFGSVYYWDSVYSAVFPSWSRWLLPLWFGALFALAAIGFWWIGMRAARWQALWFVLLGGLVSLVGHGIGIRRGLLRAPLLSQASAASALVFGVFEFVLYWCAIVALAAGARALGARARRVAGLAAAMLSLLGPAVADDKPAFEAALAEARRNAGTPSGQAFEAAVGKQFGASYGPRLSGCAKEVEKPDLRDFEVLVRLSLNGRIEEALVRPETNLARCLRDSLKDGSLPAPAAAGYWVRIGLKLRH